MIAIRTKREIDLLRKANAIVSGVLVALADRIEPGVTTAELDAEAEERILTAGGVPSFKGYQGFPASTCISVDEVIVHGIPGDRLLKEGEIVSIDVGVNYKGYYGDAALTIPCGHIDELRTRLMEATNLALANAIAAARPGAYLIEVSRAVQEIAEGAGFSVVKNFVGHGIGAQMHEEPQIPNFVTKDQGPKLKKGMVLAIEPMVNAGTDEVHLLPDGWTAVTADGKPSCHFEHSIVVTDGEPEILSFSETRAWGVADAVVC